MSSKYLKLYKKYVTTIMIKYDALKRECIIRNSSEIIITEDGDAILYKAYDNSDFVTSNIFAARIKEYVPQLHSYFVDIGDMNRRAILSEKEGKFSNGDYIMAQITTMPREKKGAQITTKIRIPGARLVLLPTESNYSINLSTKINGEGNRERLRMIGESLDQKYSLIFRTEAADSSAEAIMREYKILSTIWDNITFKNEVYKKNGNVGKIYSRNPVLMELSKYPLNSYTGIYVDTSEIANIIKKHFLLLEGKVHYIPNRIFSAKSVDNIHSKLMGRTVYLKSGANIVIEKTEALTVIDVNTSKASKSQLEVNFEAAREIMRQLRLRDIGGIIICDFIEMNNSSEKEELVQFMRQLANIDPSKPEIVGMTKLGLMEITRKRN